MAEIIELILLWLFPSIRRKKARDEEWFGVVEEKKVKSDFSVAKYKCVVIFRRDDGRATKFEVREEQFSTFEAGKRYHKLKSTTLPVPVNGG